MPKSGNGTKISDKTDIQLNPNTSRTKNDKKIL